VRVPDQKPTGKKKRVTTRPPARSRRAVQLALLFLGSVLVVNWLVGDRGLIAMLRARQQYDQLTATIVREHAENARLAEEAARLRDDPAAIEEVARRDLGLIRPGEKLFIIKDVPSPKHSGSTSAR
jgi:cell division protein FtsB